MNKKNWILAVAFLLVFLGGIASVRVWDSFHPKTTEPQASFEPLQAAANDSLFIVDMKGATEAEGVRPAVEPAFVDASTLPSQLSKIKVQGLDHVISRSGAVVEAESEEDTPVVLGDVDRAALPAAAAPEAVEASDSKITMIAAPVQARIIKSLDEYKKFKRVARGKYPAADFAKDYVVVLESTSNLPDKVFEIIDVQEDDGKTVIVYRVNIFGLDQKTNSHSAARIAKRDLPVELKQVI